MRIKQLNPDETYDVTLFSVIKDALQFYFF